MKIRLLLFAGLRERAGVETLDVELEDGLDLSGAKRELESRFPEWGSLEHVRGVLDRAYVRDDTSLSDGCELALIPPVSGGAPEEGVGVGGEDANLQRGVFELRGDPLDAAVAQARVGHPSCGAVCVFAGCTRDTNRGESVVRLEYEAYDAMTEPEMARIFERCVHEFGDPDGTRPDLALRMLCQHRTGVVEIGEPSVVIAVASPHRVAAFSACRYLIDELKKSLPVWKKEIYPDGHHWIGDRS